MQQRLDWALTIDRWVGFHSVPIRSSDELHRGAQVAPLWANFSAQLPQQTLSKFEPTYSNSSASSLIVRLACLLKPKSAANQSNFRPPGASFASLSQLGQRGSGSLVGKFGSPIAHRPPPLSPAGAGAAPGGEFDWGFCFGCALLGSKWRQQARNSRRCAEQTGANTRATFIMTIWR